MDTTLLSDSGLQTQWGDWNLDPDQNGMIASPSFDINGELFQNDATPWGVNSFEQASFPTEFEPGVVTELEGTSTRSPLTKTLVGHELTQPQILNLMSSIPKLCGTSTLLRHRSNYRNKVYYALHFRNQIRLSSLCFWGKTSFTSAHFSRHSCHVRSLAKLWLIPPTQIRF